MSNAPAKNGDGSVMSWKDGGGKAGKEPSVPIFFAGSSVPDEHNVKVGRCARE